MHSLCLICFTSKSDLHIFTLDTSKILSERKKGVTKERTCAKNCFSKDLDKNIAENLAEIFNLYFYNKQKSTKI